MANYILALDPSGNFNEGKGITGWCLYDANTKKIAKYGIINAEKFTTRTEYWKAHIDLLDSLSGYGFVLVIEDYLLYANRATSQINSRFETPQLIGVLGYECSLRNIKIVFQTASAVKTRWTPAILVRKNIIQERKGRFYIDNNLLSNHTLDAIKHAIHYATFNNK